MQTNRLTGHIDLSRPNGKCRLILSLRYFNQVIKDKKSKSDFASDLFDAFKKDHPELN
jgi:hypothetical protein